MIQLLGDVGAYSYGLGHPMKPQRMRITHELVTSYGMLDKMHILVRRSDLFPRKCTKKPFSGPNDVWRKI